MSTDPPGTEPGMFFLPLFAQRLKESTFENIPALSFRCLITRFAIVAFQVLIK